MVTRRLANAAQSLKPPVVVLALAAPTATGSSQATSSSSSPSLDLSSKALSSPLVSSHTEDLLPAVPDDLDGSASIHDWERDDLHFSKRMTKSARRKYNARLRS